MSNFEVIKENGAPIKAFTKGLEIEEAAKQQLLNLAGLPFIHSHVAVMPDVHWGMGATVGSVFATKKAVIPAAVGVDIGCGMAAQRTTFKASDLPDNLFELRSEIERRIPHGRTNNGGKGDRGAWHNVPDLNQASIIPLVSTLSEIIKKHPKLERAAQRAPNHAGTLGSGNHFIEICIDEEQFIWIMLHSGSRGIGNAIGSYFIELAKHDMEKWFISLPDKDLAYIPYHSPNYGDYISSVSWAQKFARLNRDIMMREAIKALSTILKRDTICTESAINCHHNYVSFENHFGEDVILTRKGAVDAHEGVLGIIPGSMGVKSFIVKGKGNPDSFASCSHGAGRKMSRGEARRQFTEADHIKATEGVECRKDAEVIDETPGAYKDIDAVMAAQSSLVDIVHTLKQVVCVKG